MCVEDKGGEKRGAIFSALLLHGCLYKCCVHHYVKVSINQSPLLFIVSLSNVRRLLNKKTFLYGEEGRGREEKLQLYSLDLKMF